MENMTQGTRDKVTVASQVVGFVVMTGLWGLFKGDIEMYLVQGVLVGWVVGMLDVISARMTEANDLQRSLLKKLGE